VKNDYSVLKEQFKTAFDTFAYQRPVFILNISLVWRG